jgi:hypothetical protein
MDQTHSKISFVGIKQLKDTLSPHLNSQGLYKPLGNQRELIHTKKFMKSKRKPLSMHIDIDSLDYDSKALTNTSQFPKSIKGMNMTLSFPKKQKYSLHSTQYTLDTTVTKDTSHTRLNIVETNTEGSKERPKSVTKIKIHPSTTKDRKKIKLSPLKSPPRELIASIYNPRNVDFDIKRESLWSTAKKKYTTAHKIIKMFDSLQTGKIAAPKGLPGENEKNGDDHIFSVLKNTKESLTDMINAIQKAIEFRRYKLILDQHLAAIVQHAQKSRNIELYLAALKTQGKILLMYSDIHRAMNVFKTIKHLSDANRSFTNKLKAYKYLGKCFQTVGNHAMAIFYFVKLLQTAWFCNSNRYELLAYDLIGVQYYYLGELEKAKYYHEKMMSGETEPINSELRKLGINKLINKLLEGQNLTKKNFQVKTIEEELTCYDIPPSEDEFELPSPRNFPESDRDYGENSANRFSKSQLVRNKSLQKMLDSKLMTPHLKKKSKSVPKFHEERDPSKYNLIIRANESISNPPKQQILISHLSPNRFLNNFHVRDPKLIANSYINKGDIVEGLTLLDMKSLERIKKKLERLRQNAEKALIHISSLDKFSNVKRINIGRNPFNLTSKNPINLVQVKNY